MLFENLHLLFSELYVLAVRVLSLDIHFYIDQEEEKKKKGKRLRTYIFISLRLHISYIVQPPEKQKKTLPIKSPYIRTALRGFSQEIHTPFSFRGKLYSTDIIMITMTKRRGTDNQAQPEGAYYTVC